MKHAIVFALLLLIAGTSFAQSYIPHPEITVTLNNSGYTLGDLMEITFHNPTDGVISMVGEPPYLIRFQDPMVVVFQSTLTVMHDVPANSDPLYVFDTALLNGGSYSPGIYEVAFRWIDALQPWIFYEASVEFDLEIAVPEANSNWSGIKALYDR